MSILEINLEALKLTSTSFYEKVQEILDNKDMKNELEVYSIEAKEGSNIVIVEDEMIGKVRLNSIYNPLNETKKWCEQYNKVPWDSTCVIYGLGNGYFLRELIANLNELNRIVVYEPSLDIFMHVLKNYDLSDLIMNKRICISVNGINESQFLVYYTVLIDYNNLYSTTYVFHPMYSNIFSDDIKWFSKQCRDLNEFALINHNTIIRFLNVSLKAQINNLKYLKKGYIISNAKKVWPTDIPVLIISAGPSLNKNIETVKKAQGKAIIIAVDSALKTVLAHNIVPDMLATIEVNKPMELFPNEYKEIPIMGRINSTTELLENNNAFQLYGKEEALISRAFDEIGLQRCRYEFGGSVSTAVVAMCAEMGVKVVINIGLDLAYDKNGRTHADRTEGYDENEDYIVEGIDGDKIQSRHDWYSYITWYENMLQGNAFEYFIDATEGGAKINGSTIMTLEKAIEKFCDKEVDFKQVLEQIPPTLDSQQEQKLDEFLSNLHRDILSTKKSAKQGLSLMDNYHAEIINTKGTGEKLLELEKRIFKNMKNIMKKPIFALVDEFVSALNTPRNTSYFSDDPVEQEKLDIYFEYKASYEQILEAVKYIEPLTKEAK